jgi:thymidylate kinase
MITNDEPINRREREERGEGKGKDRVSANSADSAAKPLIGIVGPCGAGKTTLADGLKRSGFRARAIAQEHSYVKDMWQRLTKPDILIFLQASCAVGGKRRNMKWTEPEWEEQQRRLRHAREHADFTLDTGPLDIAQVLESVTAFLQTRS